LKDKIGLPLAKRRSWKKQDLTTEFICLSNFFTQDFAESAKLPRVI